MTGITMYIFALELLFIAAAMFAMAAYRYTYRVSTIRLIDGEQVITWTHVDKMFCGTAAFAGILFFCTSMRFGTTFGTDAWVTIASLLGGALIGRLLAVSHVSGFRDAVYAANGKQNAALVLAKQRFPSQCPAHLLEVENIATSSGIERNIAVDNAVARWLRK